MGNREEAALARHCHAVVQWVVALANRFRQGCVSRGIPAPYSSMNSSRTMSILKAISLFAFLTIAALGLIPLTVFAQNENHCPADVFANPYYLDTGYSEGFEPWWGTGSAHQAGSSPEAVTRADLQAQMAPFGTVVTCYVTATQDNQQFPYSLTLAGIESLEPFLRGSLGAVGGTIPIYRVAAANIVENSCNANGAYTGKHRVAVLWRQCGAPRYERSSCPVGDPIFPGRGNNVQSEIRYAAASAVDLSLVDTYQSNWATSPRAALGSHWTHNWARALNISYSSSAQPTAIVAIRADGREVPFEKNTATGTWTADPQISRDRMEALASSDQSGARWRYTDTTTDTQELYDDQGRLLSVRERNGWTTTLSYTAAPSSANPVPRAGLLMQVRNQFGRELNFTYDTLARVAAVSGPGGLIATYSYNVSSQLERVTWADGKSRQYHYENSAFPAGLTGITDEAGIRFATYTYDSWGRATSSEHTGGVDKVLLQFLDGNQTTVTTADGSSRTYTFESKGNVIRPASVSAPCPECGNVAKTTTYDTSGNVASRVDFDNKENRYSYDARGRETQRIEGYGTADAKTTTTDWHPTWNLPLRVASSGKLDTFIYDSVGNLSSYSTVATSDSNGGAGFSATPTGDAVKTDWTYDSAGRLLTTTEQTGSKSTGAWTLSYDAQGNVQTLTDSDGRTANAVKHDAAGRLLEAVNTDGEQMKFAYNGRGFLLSYDVDGAVVNYDYDVNGLLTAIRGPGSYYVGFKYDAAHRLIALLTPVGQAQPASNANPFQAAELAARAELQRLAKLSIVERVWAQVRSWLSKLLSLIAGSAAANPLMSEAPVVPPIPAQVGGGIGGTSSGDPDLDALQGTSRPMPIPDPLLSQFIKMVRNITGANQSTSEACEDDSRCQSAKRKAVGIYHDLTTKRIPQYMSGGTNGHDETHYNTVIQKQNGLRDAIRRVRLYCRPLPAELPEWERVANLKIPILF